MCQFNYRMCVYILCVRRCSTLPHYNDLWGAIASPGRLRGLAYIRLKHLCRVGLIIPFAVEKEGGVAGSWGFPVPLTRPVNVGPAYPISCS